MKKLSILLITVAIGFPSSVGVTEVCAAKFDQEWAKKVLAYKIFNKSHPDVVKRRHLDRDMSANTRRSKEWLRKQLDLNCGVENDVSYLGDVLDSYDVRPVSNFRFDKGDELGDAELALVSESLTSLLTGKEYPTYETAFDYLHGIGTRSYFPWNPLGFSPVYGGFGGGQSGGSSNPPSAPIAPTPEPSTLVMLVIGLCGLGLKFRPENGQ